MLAKLSIALGIVMVAVTLATSGCGPRTYDECMVEASAKPSDTGVRLAAAQCRKQFPNPFDKVDAPATPTFDEAVPAWLGAADAAVRWFDDALGLASSPNRGEHLLKRLVQLLVVLTVVGFFVYRALRRP